MAFSLGLMGIVAGTFGMVTELGLGPTLYICIYTAGVFLFRECLA